MDLMGEGGGGGDPRARDGWMCSLTCVLLENPLHNASCTPGLPEGSRDRPGEGLGLGNLHRWGILS